MKSNIVNVLDQEMTCYPHNQFPDGETQEIIEIGLCMVDLRSRTVFKRVSMPIIPSKSCVSEYCTRLTGWTVEKLEKQGITLDRACRRLADTYGTARRLLVIDTDDEMDLLKQQCQESELTYPFGSSVMNVSTLFSLLTNDQKNYSLPEMLEIFGLSFEGREHFAYDDSYNLARLFLGLLSQGAVTL